MLVTNDKNRDMNNIIELNEQSFELEAMRASTPVLVDFYAPWL